MITMGHFVPGAGRMPYVYSFTPSGIGTISSKVSGGGSAAMAAIDAKTRQASAFFMPLFYHIAAMWAFWSKLTGGMPNRLVLITSQIFSKKYHIFSLAGLARRGGAGVKYPYPISQQRKHE
jgi:hypothetical protein